MNSPVTDRTREPEVFQNIVAVRVSDSKPVSDAKGPEEVTMDLLLRDGPRRLSLSAALSLMSALEEAVDYVRRENSGLLDARPWTASQLKLVRDTLEWVRVMQAADHPVESLTDESIERSSLLRRIRAGKRALPAPPPTSFGQPWHEVLEADPGTVFKVSGGQITTLAEVLGTQNLSETARNHMMVQINGCHWNLLKTVEFDQRYVVSFSGYPYHYSLWRTEDGWRLTKT